MTDWIADKAENLHTQAISRTDKSVLENRIEHPINHILRYQIVGNALRIAFVHAILKTTMLAVVVSRADEASKRIGDRLLEIADWDEHEDERRSDANGGGTYYRTDGIEMRAFDDLHLYLDGVASTFGEPEMLVFVSRHSGNTGPLLTAHATGNFGSAEYGGGEGSLARAAPNALSVVRDALETYAPPEYDTGIECTHHGPSVVGCPSLFVELGSDEKQWRDDDGAEAVARAVLDLRGVEPHTERTVVGFGGGHYAPRFDRVLTETDWGIGHIAADWGIEAMGDPHEAKAIIAKAFQTSGTEFALIDGSYPKIESVINEIGFEIVSETFLRETTNVSLALVGELEREICPIEAGLRFGSAAEGSNGEFVVETLPKALLEEVNGINREGVIEVMHAMTLAYETAENGSVAAERIALTEPERYQTIITELASILNAKYEIVELRDGEIFVRRETFDPKLAKAAGVENGPDFGRLAAGEAVEVDGTRIEPADVRSAREQRFSTEP